MTPIEARTALRDFFSARLRIDRWGVGFPDDVRDPYHPPSVGREEPATEGLRVDGDIRSAPPLLGQMDLRYTFMFRFDAALEYHQIPKGEAEQLALGMLQSLSNYPECLGVDFHGLEATGSVAIAETEKRDWLLVYQFNIQALFEIDEPDLVVTSGLMRAGDRPSLGYEDEEAEEGVPMIAGVDMEPFKVVAVVGGLLVYADHRVREHGDAIAGILIEAVPAGAEIRPRREGPVTNPSWSWTPGRPIFLGQAGNLTQTSPASGFSIPVGQVLTPQQINFELGIPIYWRT